MRQSLGAFVMILLLNGAVAAVEPADSEFFESKVRPLLAARCQECHGAKSAKAGLRLDSRVAVLMGGESGPAAISGKPEGSLLMDVISYRNGIQMPPRAKLPDAEIAILTEWVRRGLPWPDSAAAPAPPTIAGPVDFTNEQKSFWAFQPVRKRPPRPDIGLGRTFLDDYLNSARADLGIDQAPEADRRVMVRRITLDLTGLVPARDEIHAALADPSPDWLERIADRLLASPRYGERWGRHWLDVARYADSNGLDENLAYAHAYRYRDYVIRAFQSDKPYDQFVTEQLAGDLLSAESRSAVSADAFDPLIATGFLALGAKMLAEDDPVKMQMDIIDEQVDTVARAFLGLTAGCARCHDHKFDPLTMDDYYGLAGIFKSTQTMDTFSVVARWHERPLATPEQLKQRDAARQDVERQKQAIARRVREGTDLTLAAARRRAGDYLLLATRRMHESARLESAKPKGGEPDAARIPGAILIEAEDFVRGNVSRDRESYGQGIGVLVNRGQTPNFAEYEVQIPAEATYQLELRYAAAGSRPVRILVDGNLVKLDAAAKTTGSWHPDSQTWFVEALVALKAGSHTLRLEQPQFFPHIDKLLLTLSDAPEFPEIPEPADAQTLVPSLVLQWVKALEVSRTDASSILAPWHAYFDGPPTSVALENPVRARLMGDEPAASAEELARRYATLFTQATQAWDDLVAAGSDPQTAALPDPALDLARRLLYDAKGPFAVPADIESTFDSGRIRDLKTARAELAAREAAIPVIPEAMAVEETAPANLKIHLRGSHLTLGREVPREFPRILRVSAPSPPIDLDRESGRLQLARWLTHPEHPLTARVMVNRIWQGHFGQGLVRSPDNFGLLGQRPTHPELLDHLALEFRRTSDDPRAWSLKALHRLIVASDAYRMSSQYDATAARIDPENERMWRYSRRRMEVEVLRDSLLALSEELDERHGGSLLPTPNRAYVTSTANVNPAIYDSPRRSIYLPVVRSALYEVFTAFDFADPSTLVGQRDQTTVAPQALYMMNSRFVLERMRALADQLLRFRELDDAARVQILYETAYGRLARDPEVQRALDYLDQWRTETLEPEESTDARERRAWTSLCRAVVSANEFLTVE